MQENLSLQVQAFELVSESAARLFIANQFWWVGNAEVNILVPPKPAWLICQ